MSAVAVSELQAYDEQIRLKSTNIEVVKYFFLAMKLFFDVTT